MRELIGPCVNCGKDVYCRDGFLEGVYMNGKLLCNKCAEAQEKKPQK